MSTRAVMLAWSVLLLCAQGAAAQQAVVAVAPDSARVGDPYRLAIRAELPPGRIPVFPDTLPLQGDLENSARLQLQVDSVPGGFRYTATYAFTAWRPGEQPLPVLEVPVSGDSTPMRVELPSVFVTSVLPPDTTGVEPKPAKDVWGADRVWWPILLGALLLLALIGALVWWLRRRRRAAEEAPAVVVPALAPREWLLRELERIEQQRLVERGDWKRYYTALTDVLRQYLALADPRWGTDLTTTELATRLGESRQRALPLLRILEHADLVKFARQNTTVEDARTDLERAREWGTTFEQPAAPLLEAA